MGSLLKKHELDWLLSLNGQTIARWLENLDDPPRRQVLKDLLRKLGTTKGPASPAALGQLAWGRNWQMARHLELLDQQLVALAERKQKRLLVMMPPRHGKSVLTSQFFPAWYLGRHPDHRVILTSYEAGFAAEWGRKARDLLREFGPRLFQVAVRRDSSAADGWNLRGRRGGMNTAGVGGPITGRGADLLIVDDPVKNGEQAISETYRERAWQWWISTAFTRLEPDAVAVVIQTRWHEDDLMGRIARDQAIEDWHVLRLPAIAEEDDQLGRAPGEALWPARYDRPTLDRMQAATIASWWESLYQQRPSRHESVMFPSEYFQGDDLWYDDDPPPSKLRVLALDPSRGKGSKGDYSAYVRLSLGMDDVFYVEADLSNTQSAGQLVEAGVAMCVRFQPDVFAIESNAWQSLFEEIFEKQFAKDGVHEPPLELVENRVSKHYRVESLDVPLRNRNFRFRRTPGTKLLVDQLKNFPAGRHDDGPDALEMAYRLLVERTTTCDVEVRSPFSFHGRISC